MPRPPFLPSLCFAALLGGLLLPLSTEAAVGFKTLEVHAPGRPAPLATAVWYPAREDGQPMLVGENAAFHGAAANRDATPLPGPHPLVVISHGFGGNWRNQSWLAVRLAAEGYVVAAPNHPGTTTADRSAQAAAALWERPRDLAAVIEGLLAGEAAAGRIDPSRVGAVGHSLGGWTMIEIAGGRFDTDLFESACADAATRTISCRVIAEIGRHEDPQWRADIEQDLRDPRVRAVVSLDLGGARGFSAASLAAIPIPVLVLGAGADRIDLPAEVESAYLATQLPPDRMSYHEIPDAAHFSFMGECKPGAAELLDREVPGDGVICSDGGERSRHDIHQEIFERVRDFLQEALPPKQG